MLWSDPWSVNGLVRDSAPEKSVAGLVDWSLFLGFQGVGSLLLLGIHGIGSLLVALHL